MPVGGGRYLMVLPLVTTVTLIQHSNSPKLSQAVYVVFDEQLPGECDNVLDRCLGKSIFKYVNDLTAVFKLHTLRFSGIVRKS